jgi:hypothetical protein
MSAVGKTDYFNLSNLGVADSGFDGSSLDTGDLRRKYNFGDRVSELSIAQDPFFRLLSKVSKNATDDPSFKFATKRGSWHKRYAYVVATSPDNVTYTANGTGDFDATATYYLKMATDYNNSGNVQNVYGQSAGEIKVGASGTQPKFYLPGQVIKINLADSAGGAQTDYCLFKVETTANQDGVASPSDSTDCDAVILGGKFVRTSAKTNLTTVSGDFAMDSVYTSSQEALEAKRSYVVGSGFEEGSGYPETWKDQPYSNGYGQTQIWKTSMAMTNTARATSLKYDANEWARVWKEKLIEHKWDIEQSLLFGTQASSGDVNYTQGAVDYVLQNGNIFSGFSTTSYTADSFLDDLSAWMDPRYNPSQANVFFCDTATWNWLHKLGGYFKNNMEISTNFRADMALTGKKKVFGVDMSTINTPYGDMNVVRNIHLDGSEISILGINMKYVKYRPLVGNGVNRDTSVYVGVQTLENSGIDRRVDLILTEAGMQWEMPECHAIWKA